MSVLIADSILKHYGHKALLTDIFLKCETGQTIGILGSNGTGKTTLLQIICGIETATQKFVRVDNTLLRKAGHPGQHLVLLTQESHFPGYLSIKKLIKIYTQKKYWTELYAHDLIKERLSTPFELLSTGQKRIVEILLTLHHRAPFILMDEPFRGLSPIAREEVCRLIKERGSEKGIVITDHDHELLMRISDEIKLLKQGTLKTVNSKEDLIKEGYLLS